ncbi:MAG TPA: MFS transporter [Candidatus Saccharimonadales bacterium]|nr:MFS transporter [Candidatus Saccharimonadales bacterium]
MRNLGPLREPGFRLLFSAQAISLLGSAVAPIALAFGVLETTHSATDLGIVLTARELVMVLLLLFGGVFADRLPRQAIMAGTSMVSAVAQALTGLLFLTHSSQTWSLAVLAAVNGAAIAFWYPAVVGLIPSTVSSRHLRQANSLLGLARNSSGVAGAALGGVLVALMGPGVGVEIDAASYLAAGVLVYFIRVGTTPGLESRPGVFRELATGWREFWSRAWLWGIVIQFALVNMAYVAAISVLLPLDARRSLGGAAAYGAIYAAAGAGAIVGGLVMLRRSPRRPLLVATLGVFAIFPFFVLLAIGAPLAALLATALVGGVGLEIFGVLWSTTMQEQIPQEKLSRVSSYDSFGSFVFMPIGLAAAGPLAVLLGLRPALWVALLVMVVPTVLVLLIRDVRTMTRGNQAQPSGAES